MIKISRKPKLPGIVLASFLALHASTIPAQQPDAESVARKVDAAVKSRIESLAGYTVTEHYAVFRRNYENVRARAPYFTQSRGMVLNRQRMAGLKVITDEVIREKKGSCRNRQYLEVAILLNQDEVCIGPERRCCGQQQHARGKETLAKQQRLSPGRIIYIEQSDLHCFPFTLLNFPWALSSESLR